MHWVCNTRMPSQLFLQFVRLGQLYVTSQLYITHCPRSAKMDKATIRLQGAVDGPDSDCAVCVTTVQSASVRTPAQTDAVGDLHRTKVGSLSFRPQQH